MLAWVRGIRGRKTWVANLLGVEEGQERRKH